jgi:hypothetical protein
LLDQIARAIFDSAIRRFESSRPSQQIQRLRVGLKLEGEPRVSPGYHQNSIQLVRVHDRRAPGTRNANLVDDLATARLLDNPYAKLARIIDGKFGKIFPARFDPPTCARELVTSRFQWIPFSIKRRLHTFSACRCARLSAIESQEQGRGGYVSGDSSNTVRVISRHGLRAMCARRHRSLKAFNDATHRNPAAVA